MNSGKICSSILKMQYKGGHYFACFLAKKLFLRMVAMVPETLSCAVRLLPGLDGGLTKHHFYWYLLSIDETQRNLTFYVIYLEVESVDRAEMSPKRKFAFVGFCPRLSTFPWLGLDSPRVATSFGSYGLQKIKLKIKMNKIWRLTSRRGSCASGWSCLEAAEVEGGRPRQLSPPGTQVFFYSIFTPVYKEAILVSEKHQADFKFFGNFLSRLSDNDHSQV